MADFHPPTDSELRDAVTLITTLQLRRVFFKQLQNPFWVQPLADLGFFAMPPDPEEEEGLIREEPWPEMDYLVRVAAEAPEAVTKVALALMSTKSDWLKRGLVSIAASVPGSESAELASRILKWKGGFGIRTSPSDAVELAINLLSSGSTALGVRVAEKLFRPRANPAPQNVRDRMVIGIDDYAYDELLPRVAEALGDDRLQILVRWLEDHERLSGRLPKDRFLDLSHMDRVLIEEREQYSDSVRDALVDAVRDAAIAQMDADPVTVVRILSESGQTLSKRICLYAAAIALEAKPGDDRLLEALTPVIGWPEFGWPGFRREFARFLRAVVASTGDPERIGAIRKTLADGPFASREELLNRLGLPDQLDESLEASAEEYLAVWRHRLLSAIGSASLPDDLTAELRQLDDRFGALETEVEGRFETFEIETNEAPVSKEVLDSMAPADVLDLLESWHPAQSTWRGPSHEGLADLVRGKVVAEPGFFHGLESRVVHLRPTYLRAVISGWREAAKSGSPIELADFNAVVIDTLGRDQASPFPQEGGRTDDDPDYRASRMEALWAIGTVVEKLQPSDGAGAIERIAEALVAFVSEPAVRGAYISTTSGMDPLTFSLNSELPLATRALTTLVGDELLRDDSAVMSALTDIAAIPDPPGALHSVLGEALSRLYVRRRGWLDQWGYLIFGGAHDMTREQQIAFTTAIATQHIHSKLLEFLRPSFEFAVRAGEALSAGWAGMRSPEHRIGDWILACVVNGSIPMTDPLYTLFFDVASDETRANALGHIGWSFMHAERVDAEPLSRAMAVWDSRQEEVKAGRASIKELGDFYWWVRSAKFPVEWWAPRLTFVAESGEFDTRGMIGEQLATAASERPRDVFEAARALARGRKNDMIRGYDLLERAMPTIIARALDSGDAVLATEATALMHELGADGYIEMGTRVAEQRDQS